MTEVSQRSALYSSPPWRSISELKSGRSFSCLCWSTNAGITTVLINHRVTLAFVSSKVRAESGRQISLACSSQEWDVQYVFVREAVSKTCLQPCRATAPGEVSMEGESSTTQKWTWPVGNTFALLPDMAVQNFVGDSFRGATWVALHNGGGVGWWELVCVPTAGLGILFLLLCGCVGRRDRNCWKMCSTRGEICCGSGKDGFGIKDWKDKLANLQKAKYGVAWLFF